MKSLLDRLEANQHDPTKPVHLSASSLVKHMRCPRQWQDTYIHGNRGPNGSAPLIGTAVHKALSRLTMGEPPGDYWQETLDEEKGEVIWKDPPEKCERIAAYMVYNYWELVGKYLDPIAAEKELLFEVEGVPIPLLAYVDLETTTKIIDYKSTGYFSTKQVRVNKEWVVGQALYQLDIAKPSEIHVITRAKTDPVIVPSSKDHPLHFGVFNRDNTVNMVQQEWFKIVTNWEKYGADEPWPGSYIHEWASKYCPLKGEGRCCEL